VHIYIYIYYLKTIGFRDTLSLPPPPPLSPPPLSKENNNNKKSYNILIKVRRKEIHFLGKK
jgi:hypothetical protein